MINYGYRVRKGNDFTGILFVIIMKLVTEDIISNLEKSNIILISIKYNKNRSRVLKLHTLHWIKAIADKTTHIQIYADNRVVAFNSREDTSKEGTIVSIVIAK